MPATFTIPLITVIPGQTITATLWNNEYGNIYDNFIPAGMDDYSANDTQMQTATDPFPGGSTSRPTSLQGEIERIRFQLAAILGETYWYLDPDVDIATMKSRFDAHTHDGTSNQGPQIGTSGIADAAVTAAKIAAAVAGDGLTGGAGTALAVNVGTGLEISADAVRIAAAAAGDGLTGGAGSALAVNVGAGLEISADAVRIAAAAAGNGLSGGAGSALAVNVDDSTIEINSDALRVKDGGITTAKLATEVTENMGANIGLTTIISSTSNATLVNYSGQGKLRVLACPSGTVASMTVTVDGQTIGPSSLTSGQYAQFSTSGTLEAVTPGAGVGHKTVDILFRSSLVISKNSGGGTLTIVWERAA